MRTYTLAAVIGAAALSIGLSGALARAQTVSVFAPKPQELYPLLFVGQVQKELALTPTQVEKILAKKDEIEELEEPKDPNGDPRELTEAEVPQVQAKQNALRAKAMAEILTSRQQTRLGQILAQLRGPSALLEKPVLEVLQVTDEQQKAMIEARKTVVQEMAALREQAAAKNATQQERTRLAEKLAAAREGMVDRMVAALTPEQQKKWRALVGDKFTLKIARPMPEFGPMPPGGPVPPGGPAPRPPQS